MGAGTVLQIGNFETINGQIFGFQDNYYYSNGSIGVKWNL